MIEEVLKILSDYGSSAIRNHLPTKCKLEIHESVENSKLLVELKYIETDTDGSVKIYTVIRKKYNLEYYTKESYRKQFDEEVILWITFGKSIDSENIKIYSCSDLIRKGLRGYKNG